MADPDWRADQARVQRGHGEQPVAYYPELRLFRYFLAVAAELHFGRAARLLSISEPVLSRQIRDLERQLCTPLFERSKRSVRLTEAGVVLKTEAELLVRQADRAVAAVQRVRRGEVGEVGLGFMPSSVNHILPELVVNFRHENPGLHLSLHETSRPAMVEAIQRGELNVGFVHRPVGLPAGDGQLVEETLFTEPYAAVLPRGHRLGRRKRLALSELAGEDFILMPRAVMGDRADYLYGACRAAGFTPRVVQ